MSLFGVDYAFAPHPGAPALKAAGARFAARYIGSKDYTKSRSSKWLSPSEAKQLRAAGLAVVVVFETSSQRAEGGEAAGVADAKTAVKELAYCGLPAGQVVYFAVDYDTTVGPHIRAYFRGVASVLGKARVGVYGGYRVVKACLDEGLVTYAWQTYAWSGGRWDPRAHLQQYANGKRIGGVSVDYNRAMKANFGQWAPGATAPSSGGSPSSGGHSSSGPTRAAYVAKLLSFVGRYGPPNNRNKFNRWYYGRDVSGDAYAWCVVFACYVMNLLGILGKNGGKFAGCPAFKDHFSKVGAFRGKPSSTKVLKPGDPIVYDFNKNGSPEHFGTFYRTITSTTFQAIEGNTLNDEVAIRTRHISDVLWYAELQGVSDGGDDMTDVWDYVSVDKTAKSRHEDLPTGQWVQVYWDKNNSAATKGEHADGDYPSLLSKPGYFHGTANIALEGVAPGASVQVRIVYTDAKTNEVKSHGAIGEYVGVSYPEKHIGGYLPKGCKLRVEVRQLGAGTAKVVGGSVRLFTKEL